MVGGRHYLNLTCHPTSTREVPRARPRLWLNVKHPLIKFNPKAVHFSNPCLIYYLFFSNGGTKITFSLVAKVKVVSTVASQEQR